MSTLGIIAEYNPFHNGHLYHLRKSKDLSGAEFTIAVMGGHFLQRGEAAILDKWVRATMALSAGIDLVIEMPFVFATQDAHGFAYGGIRLLKALGIVDFVSFGCEEAHLEILRELAKILTSEPPYFQKILKAEVKKGNNFPKIREKALTEYLRQHSSNIANISPDRLKEILNQSNNILALEYLKALQKIKSSINPIPIKRVGSEYLQKNLEGQYSSATAIRKEIIQNIDKHYLAALECLKVAIPDFSYQILSEVLRDDLNPVSLSCFDQAILSQLRRMTLADIKKIHGVTEGLENRLKTGAQVSPDIKHLIATVKTKRYTRTRIQRALVHSLFLLNQKDVIAFNRTGPLYCRVIGMTERGKYLLKKMKARTEIPIVTKVKTFYRQSKRNGHIFAQKMMDYDILATDLYVLGYQKELSRIAGQDYSRKIVQID